MTRPCVSIDGPWHYFVLQDAMLLSLETIHACMSALNADDARLRATVALRLGILQADFRGDHRKACQVTWSREGTMV